MGTEPWASTYVALLHQAMMDGRSRLSREGETMDLGPTTLCLDNEDIDFISLAGRRGSVEFARLEQLSYLGGATPEVLLRVAPSYAKYREHDGSWPGAYGPRLWTQLLMVVRELEERPSSRRAVASLWTPNDLVDQVANQPRDLPCTLSLVFWAEGLHLNLHAIMRSCDLWTGACYDIPAFACLQRAVAAALERIPGKLWFTATSLHLYRRHWARSHLVGSTITDKLARHRWPHLVDDSAVGRWVRLREWARRQLQDH